MVIDMKSKKLIPGDYVLATKYSDGDPHDQWCVGFFKETSDGRHIVVDESGIAFRPSGFRRCEAISAEEGELILSENTMNSLPPLSCGGIWSLIGREL